MIISLYYSRVESLVHTILEYIVVKDSFSFVSGIQIRNNYFTFVLA